MPLKREILSTNKGHPRTLWNVIYMHRPEVRGPADVAEGGRVDPLGTGVAFTGRPVFHYVPAGRLVAHHSSAAGRGVNK